jgi:hypothetical protein
MILSPLITVQAKQNSVISHKFYVIFQDMCNSVLQQQQQKMSQNILHSTLILYLHVPL